SLVHQLKNAIEFRLDRRIGRELIHSCPELNRGAQEALQQRIVEFLSDSSSLFQAHIFFPDPVFLLFPRFNFCRACVPLSDVSLFDQWVIPHQEPPVDTISSKQSCIKFKRLSPDKPTPACR